MRVNVVAKLGWILERLAREVRGATVNCGQEERKCDPDADINYYMPARDFLKYPCHGSAVGLYTHGSTAFEIAHRFDACVTMNVAMADRLRATGVSALTIRPGTEPPRRKPVFGFVGRVHARDRKGVRLLQEAVSAGYQFRACTDTRDRKHRRIPCLVSHRFTSRDQFYESIDYLVVTSIDEGGPMPVLEAIARNIPVIAPDVGWCWEFPVIRYERGSWVSLNGVLHRLSSPPSWASWAKEHQQLFESLAR